MSTKITYAGRTTEISNKLLEPKKIFKNKPCKSYKFDVVSLYYDGYYYFLEDLRKVDREDKPYSIQVVYYDRKWKQDTQYIDEQFKDFLMEYK